MWCWDNLNIHLAPELAAFAAENKAWLSIYRLPAYYYSISLLLRLSLRW